MGKLTRNNVLKKAVHEKVPEMSSGVTLEHHPRARHFLAFDTNFLILNVSPKNTKENKHREQSIEMDIVWKQWVPHITSATNKHYTS